MDLALLDFVDINPAVFHKFYPYDLTYPLAETFYPTIFGLLEIFTGLEKLPPIPTRLDMHVDTHSEGHLTAVITIPLKDMFSVYDAFPQFVAQLTFREEAQEINIDYGTYRLEWAAFAPKENPSRYECINDVEVKKAAEKLRIPLHVLLWRYTQYALQDEQVKIGLQDPSPGTRKPMLKGIRDASQVHQLDVVVER